MRQQGNGNIMLMSESLIGRDDGVLVLLGYRTEGQCVVLDV